MLLRKRALALRKFTVIRREDGMPLEEDQEFRFVASRLYELGSHCRRWIHATLETDLGPCPNYFGY